MQKPSDHPYLTEEADNVSESSGSNGDPADVSPSSSQAKCACGAAEDGDGDSAEEHEGGDPRWWRPGAAAGAPGRSGTSVTQTEAVHNKSKALVWDNSYFFSHKNSPPPRRAAGEEGGGSGDRALTRGEVLTWMERIKADNPPTPPPATAALTQTPPRPPSPAGPPSQKKSSPWHPYGGDSADAYAPPRRTPSVASSSHSDTRPPRRPSEDGNLMAAVWVDMPRTPPSPQPEHHRRRTPRRSSGPPSPCTSTLTASFTSSAGGDGGPRSRVTVVAATSPLPPPGPAAAAGAGDVPDDAVVVSPMSPAPVLPRKEPVSLTPPSHVVLDQPPPPLQRAVEALEALPPPAAAPQDAVLQEMLGLYRGALSRIGTLESEVALLRAQLQDARAPGAAWTSKTTTATTRERVSAAGGDAAPPDVLSSASSSNSSLEGDLLSTEIEGGCGPRDPADEADTLQRLMDAVQRAKQRSAAPP